MAKAKLTPSDIEEIIRLAGLHWNKSAIARQFGIDHSTVFYHLAKASKPLVKVTFKNTNKSERYVHLEEQIGINHDENDAFTLAEIKPRDKKSYAQILSESQTRHFKKQETCKHYTIVTTVLCKCCGKVFVDTFRNVI